MISKRLFFSLQSESHLLKISSEAMENPMDEEQEIRVSEKLRTPLGPGGSFSKKFGVPPILDFGSPDSDRDAFEAVIPEIISRSKKQAVSEKKIISEKKIYHARFIDDIDTKEEGEGKTTLEEEEKKETTEDDSKVEDPSHEPSDFKTAESPTHQMIENSTTTTHHRKVDADGYDDEQILLPSDELDYFNEDDDGIPEGWTKYYDEQYQTFYYVNDTTGHTQWEFPILKEFLKSGGNSPERSNLIIDEGLENLRKFNLNNKKRAKSLSRVSIQWFGSEDFHEYMSTDATSPMARRNSEFLNPHSSNPSSPYPPSPDKPYDHLAEFRGTCNIDRKSSALSTKGRLNQDYVQMARLYKVQRPYSDPHNPVVCLLCHKNLAEDVFFPCEHHCVCRACIKKEKICEERQLAKMPDGYPNCSLCASVIKLILPLEDGLEVDKYWNWVYEEKVTLPTAFMRNWKHSADVIQTVFIDDKEHGKGHARRRRSHTNSTFCVIS